MYQNLKRANCYGTDFTGSNFNYTSLRGAHMKGCDFYGCTFQAAEFVGTNIKKSKFREAKFEDALFEGCNLAGADFRGAEFKNTIFIGTDVTQAVNLNVNDPGITIYETMPAYAMSEALEAAINSVMTNPCVKEARVLDTKEGTINTISVMKLMEAFDEETLIKGLKDAEMHLDKPFTILSYLVKYIERAQKEGKLG